jgi:hypothetical protein
VESFYVYFEDECPRLGCGWRMVLAKIGWKWVRLTDALGRTAKIKRGTWDLIAKSARQVTTT